MNITRARSAGPARAAREIAMRIDVAVGARGRADVALSGGTTPGPMFDALAAQLRNGERARGSVHLWQVDERIVAPTDERRNWNEIDRRLASVIAPVAVAHPMPVDAADLEAAADALATHLPPSFDVVHLGLGDDGHTASLVPGDPVLDVADRLVALTGAYHGTRRMTLTYPALRRARFVLFYAGSAKSAMIERLMASDHTIPAGRVEAAEALLVVADDSI